jgi:anti-sigma factor RsiW
MPGARTRRLLCMNRQNNNHSPQDEERLLQYLDGQLPATEASAIEKHLGACTQCQSLRHEWEKLDETLSRTLSQPGLSPDFTARLRERIALATSTLAGGAQPHVPSIEARRRESRVFWLGLLDGLGYGAVAAAGGYWLHHLAITWTPSPGSSTAAFLHGPAFLFALVTAGAALLIGLNLAAKNRVWRWLGAV